MTAPESLDDSATPAMPIIVVINNDGYNIRSATLHGTNPGATTTSPRVELSLVPGAMGGNGANLVSVRALPPNAARLLASAFKPPTGSCASKRSAHLGLPDSIAEVSPRSIAGPRWRTDSGRFE